MISKKILIIIIFVFLSQRVFSLVEKDFVISFSPVDIKNIDSNYNHLAESLPMLLYKELQYSKYHQYSHEELLSIREKDLKLLKNEYNTALSVLKEKYDRYYFSNNFSKDEYNSIKLEIEQQTLLINNLDISSIEDYSLSAPIKLVINNDGPGGPDPDLSDIIIKGFIEKLDNWVYVQFWVENKILNSEELFFESICSTENLVNLIPEISTKLKTIILGRDWSSLVFDIKPGDTNIIITDNAGETVQQDYEYLYPGIYNIELSKEGYISEKMVVELQEHEEFVIDLTLESENKVIISLQSFPAGADLYSGATWVGKTPVLLKSPLIPTLLTFKYEGYNDSKYIFSENSGRDIRIFMESSIIDHNKIISNKRNTFYKSFSYFLLSIPISMVSFGISSDYAYAYGRELVYSSETERLKQLSDTWYNVYLGSMFINITLFVNTIFDLADYIKSSDFL